MADVIRLKPNQYIHILDNNTNVTRLLVGPQTFTRQEHEKVLFTPKQCVTVPPRHYCRVKNPVIRDDTGAVQKMTNGQIRLRIGDEEIRFAQDPFPLYPGEDLSAEDGEYVKPLQVLQKDTALRLQAVRDFEDGDVRRSAGNEWLLDGPGTYMPRVEVRVMELIKAKVVKPNQALRLRARNVFTDKSGQERTVGEEYLWTKSGAYLPCAEEEIVGVVNAKVLTDQVALHLRATKTFTDVFGKQRKAGTEWLVTSKDAATHIPNVYEEVVSEVRIKTLNNRQYCVVMDPVDDQLRPRLGDKEVRKGECSFFLHPGERLAQGIQDIIVLTSEEALLLRAESEFMDGQTKRRPGDKWMIRGPCDYVPPVQVEVVEKRSAIALDKNEGVYVRNEKTGEVQSIIGRTYMLEPTETLWQKEMPAIAEELLQRPNGTYHTVKDSTVAPKPRDKTRVVRFSVQHNAACQIYNYTSRKPRIVFGPDLVMLGPDEQFTVVSLSGDKPKTPNVIKSLQLFLGPDFMTDIITVETSDHARLQLKLSYNWMFDAKSLPQPEALFSVPDFVGDSCKAVASRVRGAVAQEMFDDFHRNSAKIIRAAVFGLNDTGKVRDSFTFPANGLTITNIDIQSVEPVEAKTRESLQKSVQMAIEITTKSQEASARHDAERKEQSAKGRLERQVLQDKAEAEKHRKDYLVVQAETEEVEATGTAVADAKARTEATAIECESEVKQAELRAKAQEISAQADLEQLKAKQTAELEYQRKLNEMEVTKARELADIETTKFANTVAAIGQDTLVDIAKAGPETQVKLLQGLGLKGYLITDGASPINLFNTAQGMIGGGPMAS